MSYNLISVNCLAVVFLYLLTITAINVDVQVPDVVIGSIATKDPKVEVTHSFSPQLAVFTNSTELPNSILLVGDVLLARNIEYLMDKNGPSYPYRGIIFNDISANPYVVGNFEASVPLVHTTTQAQKINFSVDSSYLDAAKEAGFTHFSLANNHSYDFGKSDFEHTRLQLEGSELEPFGHPVQLERDSISFLRLQETDVAIVGIHALEMKFSDSEIEALLNYASSRSEFQLVYVHWGVEYDLTSSSAQQTLARRLVKAGADMIVGHHPHVVQEVDVIDGVPVFYSLGNYIFDQYETNDVQQGLLLNIEFSEDSLVHLVPVTSEGTLSQPRKLEGGKLAKFLNGLAKRSAPELRGFIEHGLVPLNTVVATSSKMAMINK